MFSLGHVFPPGLDDLRLANDAYEKNCGMIFEYGHTVSHAIEKALWAEQFTSFPVAQWIPPLFRIFCVKGSPLNTNKV